MADTQAALLARWADLQSKADAVEDSDRQEWFGEAAAFLQTTDHWWCQHAALTGHFAEVFVYHTQPVVQRLWSTLSQQLSSCALCVVNYHVAQAQYKHDNDGVEGLTEALQLLDANRLHDVLSQAMSVQSGDTLPGSLITALFEVLSFPNLMDNVRVNESLESALLHLKQSHELALTDGGRYQGLYRLMAHPSPQIRAMVHPMIKTLGPLEDAPDLDGIAPVLQNWADLIRNKDNTGQSNHDKGKFEQPPQLVWLAMSVLLTLIKPKAMVALLEQVWPGLVDALLQSDRPSQHMWMIMGCLRTITQVLGVQVWQYTESNAHALVQSIIRSCYESQDTRVHRAGIYALVAAVKACWTDGEDHMQQVVQRVLAFLLQGVPSSTSFATATRNMAAGSAYGLLTDCLQQGLPIGDAVALWGPSVCWTLQQAPTDGTAPNLHAASHLALLAMASDAHALHHWNQQEWGQTHTSKTAAASLTSYSCSPALWQGLVGCLPATASLLAAAAHLAFTTAATSSTSQRAGSGGFHSSVGGPALPQEVQLAMHWQQHGAAADEVSSSVRVAKYPGVLLGVLRQCTASHLELILQSAQATSPREAIADLLLVMVGVQPRLRELSQQLLLAVTNVKAVEEAVLVLMTDVAAAQVVAAAEKLVPMLQHAPAAQVLTRAATMHIFNLLAAMMAADTSGTHSTAAVMAPQLWSAVLGILQHGAAAAKLSVSQPSLQRLFQLLPQLWKTLQQQQQNLSPGGRHANQDVLDLTGDDDSAQRAQHDEAQHAESSLLWISTALEWGPLCTPATVMHWAEAMFQVLSSLHQPVEQALPEDVLSTAADILAPNAGLSDKPRLMLAPLFGHAAPGNLGMTSSLLHLPSRATPSPTPSSSSSPVQASPTTRPAACPLGIAPIPGTAPKTKQSSLTAFLSPAAKQQQTAAQAGVHAGAPAGSQSAAGSEGGIDFLSGHSQEFIEQSWQQRLHGRQPSEPPVVIQQQISHKQQQQQKKKTAEQPGGVAKDRGVRRPLEFPEDIDALLPPDWGGKAAKPDKPKGKGKQKGKVSLTAQYLHPDTSEQRLEQLTAMHHRPASQFQSEDQQTTTNESTNSNLRPPPSRSPSPVLMEDEEFDAQLNYKTKDKGPGQRAYVGLPSAPAPEPSRRAQIISIPAVANTSVMTSAKWAQRRQNPKDAAAAEVGLTIQEVQRDLLIWDYHSIIRASPGKGLKTLGMKRVPTQFQGLQDYCRVFRVLLLEELKAHLLQAEEEQQRPSSKGSSATALAQLRAMQRRSDLYSLELVLGPDDREAVRGEDLLLLTHSLSSEGIRAEGNGAGEHEAALLAIVEKVESEKELDGSRKLVAYATICLAGGDVRSSQAQRAMTLQSSWRTRRLMSWTPHLRQFNALCHMSKLPPQLQTQLLHPVAPAKTSPATLARCGGMSNSLREQLKEHYNASQQAAIASVMCPGQALFTLLQGPPGTGKTSAIIAIISALLAKHYVPPNPKSEQPLPGAPSDSPALDAPDPSPSSSLLPLLTKPKQVLPPFVSAAYGDDLSVSAGQGTGKGRAGACTTPASAPAPKFRILVCAQSNAAIDEVIARLASPGLLMGSDKARRRPGMVRMGRGETMSPGLLTWAMDQVAERYAQQDGQTLQAAAKSSKGRQRCDDIKAQLDATSDQIKQAERAQHAQQDEPNLKSTAPEPEQPPGSHLNRSMRSFREGPADLKDLRDHDQQNEASAAEKLTAGVRQKKRKRVAGDIGHDLDPVSREGSAERTTAGIQKKTNRPDARGGDKAQARDGSSERLPPGSHSATPHTEEQRRDLAKLKSREKRGETPKATQPGDLPALKKKRHLLYGQLQEARQEIKEGNEAAHKAKRGVRQAVVRFAEVVACTLSSAGGDLLGLVKGVGSAPSMLFNAIMIDEAAQALEPAALVPLQLLAPGGHVVLVGDPKQLPPTVLSRAAEASNLAQSLFERLQQAGYPVTMLSEQYRMHPAISAWPSLFFYQGKLIDGTSALPGAVASRAADFHKRPCFPPLAFFDCQQGSERGGARGGGGSSGGTSLSNSTEADVACTLFGGLMREYGHEVASVAILTPYKAQLALLRSVFAAQHSKAALASVEFATVDSFQGKEADVVLFSCVRAHDGGSGERGRGVGFLADVRRMNVGLTRARRSMWVIGHQATLNKIHGEEGLLIATAIRQEERCKFGQSTCVAPHAALAPFVRETHIMMIQRANNSDGIWKKIDALGDLRQSKNLHVILLCMAKQV
ncbi:hypothetical protein WJX77_008034 [Trebouxia sp. C0004]